MLFISHIALFTLSLDKKWEPVCEGLWIIAKISTDGGILRLTISKSESFQQDMILLQTKIRKSSQWILVSEDFAEFEDKKGVRYGMYFESESDAVDFTANICAGLLEIESTTKFVQQPPPLPTLRPTQSQLHPVLENATFDENDVDLKSTSSFDGSISSKGRVDSTRIQSMRQSDKRRRSLADFKEIDDAMGNAFLQAETTESGSKDVNFNGAISAQIVAIHDREKTIQLNTTLNTSSQPPPLPPSPSPSQVQNQNQNQNQNQVRRTSVVVDTTSCLPSKSSKKTPEENIETSNHLPPVPNISAPTTFKHAVKVTFNEEFSRFEGLPPEWKHQNQQFGVPIETLQKRMVPGYAYGIPTVLVMLKKHLFENNGHLMVGIFRLAPDKDACLIIKNQINQGEYQGCQDVNILANLIKVFFRELPMNIFNTIPDESIHKVARLSVHETIVEMETLLEGKNSVIIYWLLDLMAEIVLHEDTNKMSVRNMAIVLSPNLYAVNSENAMVALTMAQKVAEFTTNLLSARLYSKYNYQPRNS